MSFKGIAAGIVPSVWRHLPFSATEHNNQPALSLDAPFPIASSGCLDDGLQRRQLAHEKREVHIDAGFDQLGTDDVTWLMSSEQLPDNFELFAPMCRTHRRRKME